MSAAQQRNQLRIAAVNGRADPQFQRDQVAMLVSYIERMIGAGNVPVQDEQRLRELTNMTCAAFGMPSIAERDTLDRQLDAIREVIG